MAKNLPDHDYYTVGDLTQSWQVTESYIWHQIHCGKLRAFTRYSGAWIVVTPQLARAFEFGHPNPGNPLYPGAPCDLDLIKAAQDVRVMSDDRAAFEGQALTANDLGERERTNLINIIGALWSLLRGKTASGRPNSVFSSDRIIIDKIMEDFDGQPGLSKRNLEKKLAEGKRNLGLETKETQTDK